MQTGRCTGFLAIALMAASCSGALADKAKEFEAAPTAPAMTVVLMPDLRAAADPASGLSVAAWQHVVALGQKGKAGDAGPVILISCRPAVGSSSEKELVQASAQEIVGHLGSLRLGAASVDGTHAVQIVLGPEDALKALSGPWPQPPRPVSKPASGEKGSAAGTPGLTAAALEAGEGWTIRTEAERGFALASANAAPELRLRIVPRSLIEFAGQGVSKGSAAEEPASFEQAPLRLPLPFDRVQLLPREPQAGGLERVRLRFFPPALAEDLQAACDTGEMWFPVPQGWEVLYFEQRLWLTRSQTSSGEPAGAASAKPGLWPWMPRMSGAPATPAATTDAKGGLARQTAGGLAVAARVGKVSAAVLGCVSWSGPLDGLLPAFRAVLDGLRLSSGVSPIEPSEGSAVTPTASTLPERDEFALPDHTALGDSPEWLAALMAQQQAVKAGNEAILAGMDVADSETEAAMLRTQRAIGLLNEEILSLYPSGGEPSGWLETRLGQLLQEVFLEEVTGQ